MKIYGFLFALLWILAVAWANKNCVHEGHKCYEGQSICCQKKNKPPNVCMDYDNDGTMKCRYNADMDTTTMAPTTTPMPTPAPEEESPDEPAEEPEAK